jgi:hypothetical protein
MSAPQWWKAGWRATILDSELQAQLDLLERRLFDRGAATAQRWISERYETASNATARGNYNRESLFAATAYFPISIL